MKNLLMVLGPVEVEKDILKIASESMDYMRTEDYSAKWKDIFKNLQYVFQTNNDVVVIASSGTGVMDAAVCNFLCRNDKIIYINGGSFGKRWGDICKVYGLNTVEIPVEFGKSVDIKDVEQCLEQNKDAIALFATLNETSSGALTDIKAIGSVMKNYPNTLFIVDCISGLLTEEFKQDEWNVDIAVSASQKAFALPPGLGFISANEKALQYARKSNIGSFYFNIFEYISNAKRNQTPFTPPVAIVNQLEKRLEKINQLGLSKYRQYYIGITRYLREKLARLGFSPLAEHPANCVTAIYTDKCDAAQIVKIMREKYHIEVAPSGGDLKSKMLRIGNYGNINKKDIDYFITTLKKVIKEVVC